VRHLPRTILFLHPSAELYGADRTLLQLVQGLDRARWRAVVALPRRGELAGALERAGATVEVGQLGIGARASLSPGGLLKLAWTVPLGALWVRRLVRRYRPALVHTNTMVVLGGALGARLAGVPHLWHLHEILSRPQWLARLYARVVARLADRAVSNSRATRAAFDRHHPPLSTRHTVVLNGIDAAQDVPSQVQRAALRAELGVPADAPLVLLVGRVNSWKGQGLLVEAAQRLAARHPRVRYVMAGDAPPGQERLERLLDAAVRAAGLEQRVTRLPFRKDVAALYAAADLCVVPSTRPEPFGLVAIEAMEQGRAVVAADHGGVTEVVVHGQTGLLFRPGDAQALAAALDELLCDPERALRMGSAGERRQREHFTVARYVAEMEAQYLELVSEPRPGPALLPADTRIVHLCFGKANPERLNGVNRVVHQLACAQHRRGRRVEVWGLTPTPGAPTTSRPYPLRLYRRGRTRFVLDQALVAALRSLESPALVHLHGGLLPELALAARHLRRAGIAYVFTPHGTYRPEALARRRFLKRLAIAFFDRGLLAGARSVQAFTTADASAIACLVDPARVQVVPNGQDLLDVPRPVAPAQDAPRPLFGFCGRLDAHTKGLDLLLDGFAVHVARGGPGTLWLIGDGPDRAWLEGRARELKIAAGVTFHGARFGDEKLGLLARLDAFVHPSRHEGLPGAVLEAAALSLPLLVSEGTNLAPAVRASNAGLVLADESAAAVADGLAALAEAHMAGGLAAYGAGAARMVAGGFTWSRVEEQLARELYVLEAAPAARARRPTGEEVACAAA